jgi:CheY-like chemotaxis protein
MIFANTTLEALMRDPKSRRASSERFGATKDAKGSSKIFHLARWRERHTLKNRIEIEKELAYLGLLHKAREIYSELGDRAVLSYIKSSYRLLSKVYHPDLNPKNRARAEAIQQRLNRASDFIRQMKDEDLIELIRSGIETQNKRKRKILVVEDEPLLQDMLKNVFQMESYDVRIAENGSIGYEVYREFQPDLVITDIVMPKTSGLELVRNIRGIDSSVKVIFISGFFGANKLKSQLQRDVLKYGYRTLSKPFRISTILALVKDYLKNGENIPDEASVSVFV